MSSVDPRSLGCDKWVYKWMKNDWKTTDGSAVKNHEIIRCIHLNRENRSKRGQKVQLQHVAGHSGEVGNDGADFLANEGTLKPPAQDRDWKLLEARLVEMLNIIEKDTASNALVEV